MAPFGFDPVEMASGGDFITVHGHPVYIGDKKQEGDSKTAAGSKPKETPEELSARTERVMGKLPTIAKAVPKLREKVSEDIKKADAQKERVAATVARIMDTTTMRVGSEKFAQKSAKGESGQDSFGASSLRKQHVRVEGNTVHLEFPGKSRKQWQRSIHDPELASAVSHLMGLPGEKLMQYHDERGAIRPFNETHARDYLAAHGITPKNLRTYHATRLAAELLAQKGTPANEKEAQSHINDVVKAVSEHLGNTPAIARASYIEPSVLEHHARKAGPKASPTGASMSANPPIGSDQWFDRLMGEIADLVKRGEITGKDPFPQDRDNNAGDDEDGLPASGKAEMGKAMPFEIRKDGEDESKPYCVYTQGSGGKKHGCHPSRKQAIEQMRALYVNVPEAKPTPTAARHSEGGETVDLVTVGDAEALV